MISASAKVGTRYRVRCYENWYRVCGVKLWRRKTPVLRWEDGFDNLVVTAGLNKLLDTAFKTGLTTPLWYVGLKDVGTVVAADTMASHAGWAELTPYSNATRPGFVPGTISGGQVDNSASLATFNINAGTSLYGAFLADNNTVGGSTGTLYGAGDFSAVRTALNGDTLTVSVTLTAVPG